MNLSLRYMRPEDIPQVTAIDCLAFEDPWSARSYAYEVSESAYSHMVTLETLHPITGWRRYFARLNGGMRSQVIGYGGLWHIMDETHISTIAVHPDLRGQGYGELLLAAMIRRSLMLKASYIVLEVRVSNEVARKLYEKYRFEIMGTKARYYRSNGEDAYDMRLDLKISDYETHFNQCFAHVKSRYSFDDTYTDVRKPHK